MPTLSVEALEDAIADMMDQIWAGRESGPALAAEVAAEHRIRSDALWHHFERRFPSGRIGPKPTSASELAASSARAAAAKKLVEFGRFSRVDGREVLIGGKLHTLIAENRSRKVLIVFRHADHETIEIKFKDLENMTISPPKDS